MSEEKSSWDSAEFECLQDLYGSALLRCRACAHEFWMAVDDSPAWLNLRYPGSNWGSMHVVCPKCKAHEPLPPEGIHDASECPCLACTHARFTSEQELHPRLIPQDRHEFDLEIRSGRRDSRWR